MACVPKVAGVLATAIWLLAGAPVASGAQIMVVGSSVHEHEAGPGERYEGEIRLRNQGPGAQAVRVYQTDYFFFADGRNLYPAAGSHARSNGEWVEVDPSALVVSGGEEMTLDYRVEVPSDPGGAGTYWSMIMVEPTVSPSASPDASSAPAIALRATVRFGIQVATHVRGEAEHLLSLRNPRVGVGEQGGCTVEFELVNEGDVGYRPDVSLEMYDGAGVLRTRLQAKRGLVYPGLSALQRFNVGDLPEGSYQVAVVVDTGNMELFGGHFDVNVGSCA